MTRPPAWYDDFFTGLFVEMWHEALPAEVTRRQAAFLLDRLAVPPGGAVLDVPCGDGRLALEVAAAGRDVTGVDLSAEFLRLARESAAGRGLDVAWHHSDMRDMPWSDAFDGAFCFGNSFGYLDDVGNVEFLAALRRALRPGARFVLELGLTAEGFFPIYKPEMEYRVGDTRLGLVHRYEPAEQRLYTEYTVERGDRVERRPGSQRLYTCREACRMLEEAGFAVVEVCGEFGGEPFSIGSHQLLLVTTRGPRP